ncbi:hypothetical protein JMJ56_16395 [Belnapia sp. T18]|uniref:Uncharacterized protein n=1 Tax=Belnapia arida TaxID=2804533 RepID=A0ABS1U6N9_9PROT|nr:hypothetical protein [Belnapia arida]MBL6079599.1 hypothetical protein [Belnapia arida]
MRHAVEKHFRRASEAASEAFDPTGIPYIEQDIRRATHIRRTMPVFLTLRDDEGGSLVTAMLPQPGRSQPEMRPVIVGPGNSDPYPAHGEAIAVLGTRFGITLDRARCYPYSRS